jgi:hypothetical protein
MVTKPKRHDSIVITPLMESSHGLTGVRVNLNRPLINLRHGLQLDVITPDPVLPLPLHVLLNRLLLLFNKVLEEVLVREDVIHAFLPNKRMGLHGAIRLDSD